VKVTVLGTSAAMPSATRSHVSFVVSAGQTWLLDCGPTAHWQLARLGIDHRQIQHVEISHVHDDHSLGLPMLLTLGELDGREWPLRIYCPASAVERLKTVARTVYPSLGELLERHVEWRGLSEVGPDRFQPYPGLELSSAPGIHGVPDCAVRLEFEGATLVYSGDTAPAPAVQELSRGADLLLHEGTWSETIDGRTSADHSSARQAGQLAAAAGARRLGLVHLHRSYAGREQELRQEAAAEFGEPVLVPEDAEELQVGAG
jgi:ribonuclease Z